MNFSISMLNVVPSQNKIMATVYLIVAKKKLRSRILCGAIDVCMRYALLYEKNEYRALLNGVDISWTGLSFQS